jgi:hypothetical protein
LCFFSNVTLKNGDLLFVTAKETGLSGAINNVTQKQKIASFDHIGILEKEGNRMFVACSTKGRFSKQTLKILSKIRNKTGRKLSFIA